MLQKNIDKEERKKRKTWNGYYTRKTPTKKEKEEKNSKKYRKSIDFLPYMIYNIYCLQLCLNIL